MIIDLDQFIKEEQMYWKQLDTIVNRLEDDPGLKMDLTEVKHFHYLYQRTSTDLAKIATFSSENKIRLYLESLIGRAYGQIHENRKKTIRFSLFTFFFRTFPITMRKHYRAFIISCLLMFAGSLFGGLSITFDRNAKPILMPFSHLQMDPSKRVKEEEKGRDDFFEQSKASFSSFLIAHNTRISILVLALGMTFGIGTVIVLFSNGVMLGAVVFDYVLAGETKFVAGWLLPHGSIEIPAILIAGQAGLILANALIGWNRPVAFATRVREITDDLVILIFGVAIMLIWAGLIEAFFSQYHEPVLPYELKISFGLIQLILLILFFLRAGKKETP